MGVYEIENQMISKDVYGIWLQSVIGYGSQRSIKIFNDFESAEDFYHIAKDDKGKVKDYISRKSHDMLNFSLDDAESILTDCEKNNISIVSIWDINYPQRLLNISNPPLILYYKGKLPQEDNCTVAIVGTRTPTSDGIKTTKIFSYALSNSGVNIISGGAIGIDTNAHLGSLIGSNSGYCVLGCGIEYNYLSRNKCLRDTLAITGAIISEYPPFYAPNSYTFPYRNRIISGLSDSVIVVEAGQKSGAIITANLALEQGKDVFALPGSILSDKSYGTNLLIQNGAYPLTSVTDFLSYYNIEEQDYDKEAIDLLNISQGILNKLIDYNKIKNSISIKEILLPIDYFKNVKKNYKNLNIYYKENDDTSLNTEKFSRINKRINRNDDKTKNKVNINNDKSSNEPRKKSGNDIEIPDYLNENSKLIIELLKSGKMNIEELCIKTELSVSEINFCITELEIYSIVKSLPGKNYELNR